MVIRWRHWNEENAFSSRILIRAMCSDNEVYNCHLEDVDLDLKDYLYSIKDFSHRAIHPNMVIKIHISNQPLNNYMV